MDKCLTSRDIVQRENIKTRGEVWNPSLKVISGRNLSYHQDWGSSATGVVSLIPGTCVKGMCKEEKEKKWKYGSQQASPGRLTSTPSPSPPLKEMPLNVLILSYEKEIDEKFWPNFDATHLCSPIYPFLCSVHVVFQQIWVNFFNSKPHCLYSLTTDRLHYTFFHDVIYDLYLSSYSYTGKFHSIRYIIKEK